MSIARLFQQLGHRWGQSCALTEDSTSCSLTFVDLANAVFGFADTMTARGLRPGDRIALIGDSDIAYLIADYGSMCGGFVRVPLDPSLSIEELAAQIADAEAPVVMVAEPYRAAAEKIVASVRNTGLTLGMLPLDRYHANVAAPLSARQIEPLPEGRDTAPSALASLNYTGGSSGAPKAVMLTQSNLRAIVQNVAQARAMGPGDVLLNMRPLWPIAAVIVLAHLVAGGNVVLGGRFEPARFLDLMARYRAAATTLVPTHLVRVVRDLPAAQLRELTFLRTIDIGAAAVPLDVFELALEAFGPKIGILYGLTEASWSCYQPPAMLDVPAPRRLQRMRSVGRPVLGCDVKIVDGAREVLPGETGEIVIQGAHVMQGYWKRPELTAAALREGWFHTGDLGVIGEDGVVSVVGRLKNVIRSGGKSVDPDEVEKVLGAIEGLAEVAVVGLPDKEWGEVVVAAVVIDPGAALDSSAISDLLRRHAVSAQASQAHRVRGRTSAVALRQDPAGQAEIEFGRPARAFARRLNPTLEPDARTRRLNPLRAGSALLARNLPSLDDVIVTHLFAARELDERRPTDAGVCQPLPLGTTTSLPPIFRSPPSQPRSGRRLRSASPLVPHSPYHV